MDISKASNDQLLCIIQNDKDITKDLLNFIVYEAMDRGLFNKLITWIFSNLLKSWKKAIIVWNMELDDVLSTGYCGVLNALSKWRSGKASFKTFAYMNIRSEFVHLLDKENTQKREINKITSSYDILTSSGEPILSLLRSDSNVERIVIKKITFEDTFSVLDPVEVKIVSYFLKGYTFTEINKLIYKGKRSGKVVRAEFYEALEKLGLEDFVIDQEKAKVKQQKLTTEIVKEIREGKRTFKTKQAEADYYGISRKLIQNIRNYKTWKEVV